MEPGLAEQGQLEHEWLVTDQRGLFAMGTLRGLRTRKYHGFSLGIAGRSETAFLVDLEIEVAGRQLWPHVYAGPHGAVIHPDPKGQPFAFSRKPFPAWSWDLPEGRFVFRVEPATPGGIRLEWELQSGARQTSLQASDVPLRIRPFWAMRDLHAVGGNPWVWHDQGKGLARVTLQEAGQEPDQDPASELHCCLSEGLQWQESGIWFYRFHYAEEARRGYLADEDLFSAGELWTELSAAQNSCSLWVSLDASDLKKKSRTTPAARTPVTDFVLTRPAGIVAGFPWFGEWGRDTFIALPGVVAGWLEAGESEEKVLAWTRELLGRWGEWIHRVGMLPNLIEREGTHQWDSADATLWWCHSLAALWQLSLGKHRFLAGLQDEFISTLSEAIEAIESGRHRFLRLSDDGLLEVTEAHSTWMDARVEGAAVTPRVGRLPEINALWFQARCLHKLWTQTDSVSDLEAVGEAVLHSVEERERPNRIFLHNLPLAPSFVLNDRVALKADLEEINRQFWTPVGLRTLSPRQSQYQPYCVGTQEQRDRAYHQGSVWGWLGGHYEMALARLMEDGMETEVLEMKTAERMFTPEILAKMPIEGHIAEIFDAKAPHAPRGAPAQAWSLACLIEQKTRKSQKLDLKLSEVLAKRWIGREGRTDRKRRENRGKEGQIGL